MLKFNNESLEGKILNFPSKTSSQEQQIISESATYDILSSYFFNFINDSYESVSSTTFKRIARWAENEGISKENLFSRNILEKLSANKKKRVFFTNDEFCSVLDNLYAHRGKSFSSWNKEDFFRHVGFSGGSDFENFALDHIFPVIFGKSLRDVATYASLYSSYATRQRNLEFSQNYVPPQEILEKNSDSNLTLDDIVEEISITVDTFPGIKTRVSEAALFDGYVQKVLQKSTRVPIYSTSFEFIPHKGSFRVSASSTKDEQGSFDWREKVEQANFIVRSLVSPIVESKIETENRQETLENIISTFTTGIFKDISSLKRADQVSGEHNIRVGREACELAAICGLSRREQRAIAYGAPQHDLGKVVIPQSILLNEGFINAEQYRIMQEHTSFGAIMTLYNGYKTIDSIFSTSMSRNLDSRFGRGFSDLVRSTLEDLVVQGSSVVLYHQEFANGNGYPTGLKNEEASRPVKLVQVVDFKDAFSAPRPYKEAHPFDKVLSVLSQELSNGHFDKEVGEFLIRDYFPFRDTQGVSHSSWVFNESMESYSTHENDIVAALRGNVPLRDVYSDSLLEKGREVFSKKPEIYYSKSTLESQIKNHLVGFYEDVRFQERLRKELEDPSSTRNYESLKKGRIFDVYSLRVEDQKYLKDKFPDETLDSVEYLRHLESRINDPHVLNLLKAPLQDNRKYHIRQR